MSAASLLSGAVAPGELVSLMGSAIGPASPVLWQTHGREHGQYYLGLDAGTVRVLARPRCCMPARASLTRSTATRSQARATTKIQIVQNGQTIGPISIPVAPATPGIFTQSSGGVGQGSILNEDYSVNTPANPASAGLLGIQVYMTGTGQDTPTQVTGAIDSPAGTGTTVLTVTATVAGCRPPSLTPARHQA